MITLLNIAEQIKDTLGKGNLQALTQAVKNAYATAVKQLWFEGRESGISEVNGSLIFTFNNVLPAEDENTNQFFVTIPSSYMELPHEMGINHVSFMHSQDTPFVRLPPNSFGLFAKLRSFAMGGNQVFMVEGNRMYFPKMIENDVFVNNEVRGMLLKLTVALDTVDADEPLNISPLIQDMIVTNVLAKYQIQPDSLTENLT